MKPIAIILLLFCSFFWIGCHNPQKSADKINVGQNILLHAETDNKKDLIEVDVTKDYPKKDFNWEDLADIEFIPLETKDDFLCEERACIATLTDNLIVIANWSDGNVFIFDRKGNAVKKFNHQGPSGEEYTKIGQAFFDNNKKELYVNDMFKKKIFVYDLDGNYKRSFGHIKNTQYSDIGDFSENDLICYDASTEYRTDKINPFLIISKQTGAKIREIIIPLEKKLSLSFTQSTNNGSASTAMPEFPIMKFENDFIINELSTDTIYLLKQNYELQPIAVRTPPIQSMSPSVFLLTNMNTRRYFFMWTVKKEYNWETNVGFPTTSLVYDRKEKTIHEFKLYYQGLRIMTYSTSDFPYIERTCYVKENTYVGVIQAHVLKKKEKSGELKGRLKEIAASLKEDDNPVLMLIKFKE